jgi:hypothetical protein
MRPMSTIRRWHFDQLFLICWHDLIHLEQITRILTEKQP